MGSAFLACEGISHGLILDDAPVLEYLYYLAQVSVSMSPIANTTHLKDCRDNPFVTYFRRGLRVSLSTDDPLMFHVTHAPLIEEYVTARNTFELDEIDLSEIARS